jgi:TolB-like protein/Tfp pilus assembly protein PilF
LSTLAVLPLENRTGDESQDGFVDGMTDDLIASLARLGGPRVTSVSSVFKYKRTDKPVAQIARELGVSGIVRGSVTRFGGKLQVKAQLLDAANEKTVWADSFERDSREVAALRGDVAQAIARQLGVAGGREEKTEIGSLPKIAPEAYEAYVRGRYYWNQGKFPDAVQHFQKALNAEPAYPAAWAGLAAAYAFQPYIGMMAPREAFPKAKAAALKALELAPELAEPHAVLAYSHMYYDYDFPAAEAEFKRALAADPNSVIARQAYSIYLAAMLRPDEARAQIEKALELDPLSAVVATWVGFELYYERKYDEAIRTLQEVVAANPQSYARFWLGRSYQALRRYEEAVPLFEAVGEKGALGHLYGVWGKRAEAEKMLREQEKEARQPEFFAFYDGALTSLGLGDKDRTMQWLDKCYAARVPYLVWLLRDPRWDTMRSDPRFTELLKKIGFPQVA